MEDFMEDFMDDFIDLMQDALTVEVLTSGELDPNTGAGGATTQVVLTQPCSDQDASPTRRFRGEINSGVTGSLPISICYTAYFTPPVLSAGETLVYRVNGRKRPLMRQGPPQDIGAQRQLMELELGPPED